MCFRIDILIWGFIFSCDCIGSHKFFLENFKLVSALSPSSTEGMDILGVVSKFPVLFLCFETSHRECKHTKGSFIFLLGMGAFGKWQRSQTHMNVFNLMNNQSLSIAQEDVAGVSHLPSPLPSFLLISTQPVPMGDFFLLTFHMWFKEGLTFILYYLIDQS